MKSIPIKYIIIFVCICVYFGLVRTSQAGEIGFSANYQHNWGPNPPWKSSSPSIYSGYGGNYGHFNLGNRNLWFRFGYTPRAFNFISPIIHRNIRFPIPNYRQKMQWIKRLAILSAEKQRVYAQKLAQAQTKKTNHMMIIDEKEKIPTINIDEPLETPIPKVTEISQNGTVVMNLY